MNKNILKIFYYIGFILLFFANWVIFIIPASGANFYVGLLIWLLLIIAGYMLNPDYFNIFFRNVFKLYIVKYYLIFILFCLGTTFVHILIGSYTANFAFYFVRIKNVFISILIYFIPVLAIFYNIKPKKIAKIFISFVYAVLIIGIIQYLSYLLNLSFIDYMFNFFTNERIASHFYCLDAMKSGLRINAIFSEPADLCLFLFITMPIIYNVVYSKDFIYKNKYINFFIKNTFFIFMFANIIFSKSPMFGILCIAEFIVIILYNNIHFIKKYFIHVLASIIVIISSFCFIYNLNKQDLSNTYLSRIIDTLPEITSLEGITKVEPSLGSRLVSFTAQIHIFKNHPFFGVGLYNVEAKLNNTIFSYGLPLTRENLFNAIKESNVVPINKCLMFTSLADIGLIGVVLLILFMFKNYICLTKIKNFYTGFEKHFIQGFCGSIIAIFCIAFYTLSIDKPIMWALFGMVVMYLYDFKYKKMRLYCTKKEIILKNKKEI